MTYRVAPLLKSWVNQAVTLKQITQNSLLDKFMFYIPKVFKKPCKCNGFIPDPQSTIFFLKWLDESVQDAE